MKKKRISSCKFCAVSVPCGCAVNTATHDTGMYFVGCGTYTNATVDIVHPINMPYLRYYFNDSFLNKLIEERNTIDSS